MRFERHRWFAVALLLSSMFVIAACDENDSGSDCDPNLPICFEPNIRVNEVVEGDQTSASIDVGPEGNLYVAWVDSRNGSPDIFFGRSEDGGQSFTYETRVHGIGNTEGTQWQPDIAVDETGTIYVTYVDRGLGNRPSSLFVSASTNLGATFEQPRFVDQSSTSAQTKPTIDVDASGRIFVAWMDRRYGNTNVLFCRSEDGARNFETPIRVADTPSGAYFEHEPDLAVDSEGNIYVIWHDGRRVDGWGVYMAKSVDGGNSFQRNVHVDDAPTDFNSKPWPEIAVGVSGTLHAAWHDARAGVAAWQLFYTRSTNGGESFEPSRKLSTDYTQAAYPLSVNVDPSGNVWIAWPQSSAEAPRVVVSTSQDDGESFSIPTKVHDGADNHSRLSPSIAAPSGGRVYAVWMDTRDQDPWNVFFARGQLRN